MKRWFFDDFSLSIIWSVWCDLVFVFYLLWSFNHNWKENVRLESIFFLALLNRLPRIHKTFTDGLFDAVCHQTLCRWWQKMKYFLRRFPCNNWQQLVLRLVAKMVPPLGFSSPRKLHLLLVKGIKPDEDDIHNQMAQLTTVQMAPPFHLTIDAG